MSNNETVEKIAQYFHEAYGEGAEFKKDQLESIVSVINNCLTLVVQKTGWGKSLVYFLAARYFRDLGYGPSIIVSPLLSLMRNQQEASNKFGLRCVSLNSDNRKDDYPEMVNLILSRKADIIFTTPEFLNKPDIRELIIGNINQQAMLVIDEAHCISEWGHDFRPDYARIKNFVSASLEKCRLHILATTATANNVVIKDLQDQFSSVGEEMKVIRGELIRDALYLEVVKNLSFPGKFVWIRRFLAEHKGSGIIYTLSIRDGEILVRYLQLHNIKAEIYHSRVPDRKQLESDFYDNTVPVLVATSALGMGYDKPDISFVIHLQPSLNMLEYYQQIGRAGRGINKAWIYLLSGDDDNRLAGYFVDHSFPEPWILKKILRYTEEHPLARMSDYLKNFNLKKSSLEAVLKHLVSRGFLSKEKSYYVKTERDDNLDDYIAEKSRIIDLKRKQYDRMKDFINYDGCLMSFISAELDDPFVRNCGRCSWCRNTHTSIVPSPEEIREAADYINYPYLVDPASNLIKPREKLPSLRSISQQYDFLNNEGYFLAKYQVGLGELVKRDKYFAGEFSEQLVSALGDMIKFLIREQAVVSENVVVTYVPSLKRPSLVRDLAEKLSKILNIPCVATLKKIQDNQEQKSMLNSEQQFQNVSSAFAVSPSCIDQIRDKNIYLIDDMVDFRWTFTWCGILLHSQGGVKSVTPFALADTSSE